MSNNKMTIMSPANSRRMFSPNGEFLRLTYPHAPSMVFIFGDETLNGVAVVAANPDPADELCPVDCVRGLDREIRMTVRRYPILVMTIGIVPINPSQIFNMTDEPLDTYIDDAGRAHAAIIDFPDSPGVDFAVRFGGGFRRTSSDSVQVTGEAIATVSEVLQVSRHVQHICRGH